MKKIWLKTLHYSPRILAILYVIFLNIFALDMFQRNEPILKIILGIFMHMLPGLIALIAIIIAWKWEYVGGALFIAVGIAYTLFFHTYAAFAVFMLISFPAFLIGGLLILDEWIREKRRRN